MKAEGDEPSRRGSDQLHFDRQWNSTQRSFFINCFFGSNIPRIFITGNVEECTTLGTFLNAAGQSSRETSAMATFAAFSFDGFSRLAARFYFGIACRQEFAGSICLIRIIDPHFGAPKS